MKKIILSAIIFASVISCTNNEKVAQPSKEVKQEVATTNSSDAIDIERSLLYWKGTKAIGGGHQGTLKFHEGKLKFENGEFKGGSFTIDMNSITCSDIKDEESNADLVGHLKSDDFFAVSGFPTAVVDIFDAELTEGNVYKCAANVRIKEKEKQMVFNVNLHNKDSKNVLVGRLDFDRTDFGIVYNSGNFFKSLGDKVIDDEVLVKFEIYQK